MAQRLYLFLIIFIISILAACSAPNNNQLPNDNSREVPTSEERDSDIGKDNINSNELASETDQQTYMKEKLADSYFERVEIEVEYPNNLEYEVEIDKDNDLIKAKIDDDLEGRELIGIKAFDFIYERMEELAITPTSNIDDIAEQVISLFDLPNDYEEIEVEIHFHNGSKLELEDKIN